MSRNFVEEGHFVCECGREFSKSQSYYAHCSHCKIHLDDRYDEYKHNPAFSIPDKKRAWAKGHTMQEDTPQGGALRSTTSETIHLTLGKYLRIIDRDVKLCLLVS